MPPFLFALSLIISFTAGLSCTGSRNADKNAGSSCLSCKSDGLLIPIKEKGKFGFIDTSGNLRIPFRYDSAGSFNSGRAVVLTGNKFGFIDSAGNYVIPARFDDALPMHGNASVVKQSGKWGVINQNGEWLIEPSFDKVKWYTDAIIKKPVYSGEVHLYDIYGQESDTDSIYSWMASSFHDGLIEFKRKGKWGLMSISGKIIAEPMYDAIGSCAEQMMPVKKGGKWTFIDCKGKEISYWFDSVTEFSNGLAAVMRNNKWGYINNEGKNITGFIFSNANSFSHNRAWVQDSGSVSIYMIDRAGKKNQMASVNAATSFASNTCGLNNNGKWYLIDSTGKRKNREEYDEIVYRNGYFLLRSGSQWGLADSSGKEIIAIAYDEIYPNGVNVISVCRNKKWGMFNAGGEQVLPVRYDRIDYFPFENKCYIRALIGKSASGSETFVLINGYGREFRVITD